MSLEDSILQQQVRALLVRHWVDTRRLDYSVIGGVIYMRGTLLLMYEHPHFDEHDEHGVSDRALMLLERDLTRLPGVKAVHYDLSNWIKSSGMWIRRVHVR